MKEQFMEKETKDLPEDKETASESGERPGAFKAGLAVFLAVALIFAAIILVTGFLGSAFGKAAENTALIAVAVILVILLIKSKRS